MIPPPPKINPGAVLLQSTQILTPLAEFIEQRRKRCGLPHQGSKEQRRRAKQLARARAKP